MYNNYNSNYNNVSSIFRNPDEVTTPVSEGKTYEVKIEDIAQKGDGIARIEGYVIFVPNTRTGQEVTIKIDRVLPKYAFASVVSGNEPEPETETEPEAEAETEAEEQVQEVPNSPFFISSDETKSEEIDFDEENSD